MSIFILCSLKYFCDLIEIKHFINIKILFKLILKNQNHMLWSVFYKTWKRKDWNLHYIGTTCKLFLFLLGEKDKRTHPTAADVERVHSCFKQLVRDWSQDGVPERKAAYDKIINKISDLFKVVFRVTLYLIMPKLNR